MTTTTLPTATTPPAEGGQVQRRVRPLDPRPHEIAGELRHLAHDLRDFSQAQKRRLAQHAAREIARLRGQRKTLADLLEQATAVLIEVRRDEDDAEARARLGALIGWCDRAVKDVRVEMLDEAA